MKDGDIIRATRVSDSEEPTENQWFEGERWGVISYHSDREYGVDWLINPAPGVPYVLEGLDTFEVVPEDQWPDDVCVALAKRALIGED